MRLAGEVRRPRWQMLLSCGYVVLLADPNQKSNTHLEKAPKKAEFGSDIYDQFFFWGGSRGFALFFFGNVQTPQEHQTNISDPMYPCWLS